MTKWIMAAALALLLPAQARAAITYTGGLINLEVPGVGDSGSLWGPAIQRNFIKLSTSALQAGSTVSVTISPSSWTFTSSSGTATSSMTLTGPGGSTKPYVLTASSGIYLSAGEIAFKSGAGGIVFPDQTRQVTAAAAASIGLASTQTWTGFNTYYGTSTFNGAVRMSSWSMVNVSGSETQASMLVCKSSVTITPVTSTVTIKGDGAVTVTGPSRAGVGVMQNSGGASSWPLSQTVSVPLTDFGQATAGYHFPLNFERTITGLTPGTQYTWCIAFMMDSGVTMTIPGALSSQYQFSVKETTLK